MLNPSENTIERLCFLLSHELRTPISALQGAISLLQMHPLHEKLEAELLLTLAAENTERLTRVVEDILDWYEIVHSANLFQQNCNAALLIQQAVNALQSFASQQQIQIHLNTPACICVNADQHHLSRALMRLIHNAIKFSPPQRQVTVTAQDVHTADSASRMAVPHVLIAIADEGVGIPATDLDRVFQPFYQVDSSDARPYGGLGLELAICHQVIERHAGTIWVESQLGQGSTFYIALPVDDHCPPDL